MISLPGSLFTGFDDSNSYYCSACNVYAEAQQQHVTSVVHVYKSTERRRHSPYMLPASNRGYQLMCKAGWDQTSGLGVHANGRTAPVATVLKRDRKGKYYKL